jgi:hypothetical protein
VEVGGDWRSSLLSVHTIPWLVIGRRYFRAYHPMAGDWSSLLSVHTMPCHATTAATAASGVASSGGGPDGSLLSSVKSGICSSALSLDSFAAAVLPIDARWTVRRCLSGATGGCFCTACFVDEAYLVFCQNITSTVC